MVAVVHHLMGPAEIAAHLQVSRQRVTQLMARPDFPAPAALLKQGKIWHTEDIDAWNATRKQPRRTR